MILTDNVATLIHDLKNPVIAQEQVLNLLLQNVFGELSVSQIEVINQLKDTSLYLKNIINSALDNYRLNSSEINLVYNRFDLEKTLCSVIKILNPLASKKSIKIRISNVKCLVYADMFQIERVLTNLLGNAIHYSFENSTIEICCKKSKDNLIFYIKNESSSVKNIKRVFEKFESTTNSGLGLYLVKKIITAHNGSVFAKKETINKYVFGFVIPNL